MAVSNNNFAGLPAEIWQNNISSYLSNTDQARLSQTCKAAHNTIQPTQLELLSDHMASPFKALRLAYDNVTQRFPRQITLKLIYDSTILTKKEFCSSYVEKGYMCLRRRQDNPLVTHTVHRVGYLGLALAATVAKVVDVSIGLILASFSIFCLTQRVQAVFYQLNFLNLNIQFSHLLEIRNVVLWTIFDCNPFMLFYAICPVIKIVRDLAITFFTTSLGALATLASFPTQIKYTPEKLSILTLGWATLLNWHIGTQLIYINLINACNPFPKTAGYEQVIVPIWKGTYQNSTIEEVFKFEAEEKSDLKKWNTKTLSYGVDKNGTEVQFTKSEDRVIIHRYIIV